MKMDIAKKRLKLLASVKAGKLDSVINDLIMIADDEDEVKDIVKDDKATDEEKINKIIEMGEPLPPAVARIENFRTKPVLNIVNAGYPKLMDVECPHCQQMQDKNFMIDQMKIEFKNKPIRTKRSDMENIKNIEEKLREDPEYNNLGKKKLREISKKLHGRGLGPANFSF